MSFWGWFWDWVMGDVEGLYENVQAGESPRIPSLTPDRSVFSVGTEKSG